MADSQTATSAPDFKSAHFIGIGGAGMSGIALVLHERGYVVTGSDLKTSRYSPAYPRRREGACGP